MDLTEPDGAVTYRQCASKPPTVKKTELLERPMAGNAYHHGDSDIHLVLARSEEGTNDGRGCLCSFIRKKMVVWMYAASRTRWDQRLTYLRISVWKNAKAELVGERRLGLIKYVMV